MSGIKLTRLMTAAQRLKVREQWISSLPRGDGKSERDLELAFQLALCRQEANEQHTEQLKQMIGEIEKELPYSVVKANPFWWQAFKQKWIGRVK